MLTMRQIGKSALVERLVDAIFGVQREAEPDGGDAEVFGYVG